ncbi:MAG TPA: isochorismatase family protein [Thermoanaerobaculia bacterium]|nr:isochorismatase family protein [Thermoanaerobaculia bacterium]
MPKLDRANSLLIIVDMQERLLPVIHEHEALTASVVRLIRGCAALSVPILVTEQYVKGLGATTSSVREALEETGSYKPMEKMSFSSLGSTEFGWAIEAHGRRQLLVAGIEAHVCVYQTVVDLLERKFEVTVVADAIASRALSNKTIALDRMAADGAQRSSVEMALFELTVRSGTDEFRAISKLVK